MSSQSYRRRWFAVFAFVAGLSVVPLKEAPAQPARDRVLDQVYLVETEGRLAVRVELPFIVRYVTHFPQYMGNELRVLLMPVNPCQADKDALEHREAVRPPRAELIGLREVVYEGDIQSGPFLTFEFSEKVAFEVIPGRDFRSLTVFVTPLPKEEGDSTDTGPLPETPPVQPPS